MHFWFEGLSFVHQYVFQGVVKDDPVSVFQGVVKDDPISVFQGIVKDDPVGVF
jgi:hypothetical protein